MKIALAGNPNSGKTTLFNAITGKVEYVGNWAGVTVEKKEGSIKPELNREKADVTVVDLPGAYSMSPYTSEESITRDFVQKERPDVIINIVDSANLSRSLFFTTQLLELGIPVVIALNKYDLTEKKENSINLDWLSERLQCPVIATIATKSSHNSGLKQLIAEAVRLGLSDYHQPAPHIGGAKRASTQADFEKADKKRYDFVARVVADVEHRKISSASQTAQDKADRILANKWLGIPIFAAVIWLTFSISQAWLGPVLADIFVGWLDSFYEWVAGLLGGVSPFLSSLLLDGIIGGVSAVVGFLPLIMVLFFCLALLEDCGYMARVAVVMDRFFKRIGLSGKSVIPMVVSTGCAIPGIMASRTIKDVRQRRTTAMLSPFMPCGAKLPIIALFAGLFFGEKGWVGTSMYFMAIIIIVFSGLIVRRITGDTSKESYFIMELPEYRWPSLKRATISMFSRAKAFIIKAGTIILVCNAVVQILQSFNWQLQVVGETAPETSILATIASPFALLFIPLGFGLWQFAAAAITGFIAKENVVGTLAVTFAVTNFIDVDELALVGGAGEVSAVFGIGAVAALSYLVFNLFTPPCFAAIGAMRSEMESKRWFWGGLAFQLSMGYVLAFLVYQIGTLITTGAVGSGFAAGLVAVVIIISTIGYLMWRGSRSRVHVKEGVTYAG